MAGSGSRFWESRLRTVPNEYLSVGIRFRAQIMIAPNYDIKDEADGLERNGDIMRASTTIWIGRHHGRAFGDTRSFL